MTSFPDGERPDLAPLCRGRQVLAFPGQGIDADAVRAVLAQAAGDPLVERLGEDLAARSWDALDLTDTTVTQPAVFVAGVVRARQVHLADVGLVLGHSLGEWTSLTIAGALDPFDALRLVQARAATSAAAASARGGEMVAVMGLDPLEVEWARRLALHRAGGALDLAGDNGRGQVVLSGDRATVAALIDLVGEAEGLAQRLDIAGAFHSPLMAPAVDDLEEALARADLRPPRVPWLSTIDLRCHEAPDEIRRLLVRALVLPVRWLAALGMVAAAEPAALIDVGPGDTLRKLARRSARGLRVVDLPDAVPPRTGERL